MKVLNIHRKGKIVLHKGFFDAKRRRHLVVPLIYFWCGAMRIDVPLSGSVCGRQATPVLLFLFRLKENAHRGMSHCLASRQTDTLAVKVFISIKVIVRVDQALVDNLSLFDELADTRQFGVWC